MHGHTEHILIVEDSEFNARILSRAVAGLAPVTIAKSGGEALEFVDKQDFDIILLDIMLPDISGFEVCAQIMESEKPTKPAIIFVTSLEDVEDEEKGLALGAVDYTYKPVISSIVQARVKNHLLLSRARREMLELNMELTRLATVDSLTGIYNRRHFYELMDIELSRAERYDQEYALIALDLDHFKSINDTHGHDRGDAVLKTVTSAWTGTLRTNDILGRVGGDEFSIFLPQTNKEHAKAAAERLLKATRKLDIPDGNGGTIKVTASIGIAIPSEACRQTLSICADKALYEAKDGGRDRSVSCCWTENCGSESQ